MKTLPILIQNENHLELPKYQTEHAAGMDLRAFCTEQLILKPGERLLINTGLKMAIPEGYEGQVRSRSGLAHKFGVFVLNSPGTIDSDYRGEVKVLLFNSGKENFAINNGDRIAQLVVAPYVQVQWKETTKLDDTTRGSGGYGHTGQR